MIVHSLSTLQIELGSWNLLCIISRDLRYAFLESRLFSLIAPSHSPKNVVFWRIFLIFFEFVHRVIPLQIELGSWNFVCTLSRGSRCAFWGSILFSHVTPPHSPEYVFFWYFYFIFWVSSSQNSPSRPLNWAMTLKFSIDMYFRISHIHFIIYR